MKEATRLQAINKFVILRKIQETKSNDLLDSEVSRKDFGEGEIVSITEEMKKETGLKRGDVVYYLYPKITQTLRFAKQDFPVISVEDIVAKKEI